MPVSRDGWKVILNGSVLEGGTGDGTADGCLLVPPDGLDVPDLTTEDQSYPQRDGVEHFADWYGPRLVTLTGLVGGAGCSCDGGARAAARRLMTAWGRECDDTELVVYPPCGTDPVVTAYNFDGSPSGVGDFTAQGSTVLAVASAFSRSAPNSLRATQGGGTMGFTSKRFPVVVGQSLGFTGWFRASTVARTVQAKVTFYNAAGTVVGATTTVSGTDPTGVWTGLVASAAPSSDAVTQGDVTITFVSAGSGEVHNADDLSFTVADSEDTRATTGPFGVKGRPRVAKLPWRKGKKQIADATLRFDSADQRLFILDPEGTPGSGVVCTKITAPTGPTYAAAVAGQAVDHHWPLDFPHLVDDGFHIASLATDVIGGVNAGVSSILSTGVIGRPVQVPPISYSLSLSAVQGPGTFIGPSWPATGSYTSGMFGFWLETPVDSATPAGASILLEPGGNFRLGIDSTAHIASPVIKFGSTEVAMNTAVQNALGFTAAWRGQPVFIAMVWIAGTMCIFVGHPGMSAPFLAQTVTGTGKPASVPPNINIYSAKIGNVISGINHYTTPSTAGETLADALVPAGLVAPTSALTLPAGGDLCAPVDVSFDPAGTFGDVYIFNSDGDYVGINSYGGAVTNPTELDTETGTATRNYGQIDATPDILGDPFLTIAPGETLNVFGGGAITICYRPAVLSA